MPLIRRYRRLAMWAFSLAGLGLTVLGGLLDGYAQAVLLEVGVSLGLFAAFLAVERALVDQVEDDTARAAGHVEDLLAGASAGAGSENLDTTVTATTDAVDVLGGRSAVARALWFEDVVSSAVAGVNGVLAVRRNQRNRGFEHDAIVETAVGEFTVEVKARTASIDSNLLMALVGRATATRKPMLFVTLSPLTQQARRHAQDLGEGVLWVVEWSGPDSGPTGLADAVDRIIKHLGSP